LPQSGFSFSFALLLIDNKLFILLCSSIQALTAKSDLLTARGSFVVLLRQPGFTY